MRFFYVGLIFKVIWNSHFCPSILFKTHVNEMSKLLFADAAGNEKNEKHFFLSAGLYYFTFTIVNVDHFSDIS